MLGKMDSKSVAASYFNHRMTVVLSPLYTLILPLRIMPYTDGRSWARREGFDRHHGIRHGEELTDEDDDIEEDS